MLIEAKNFKNWQSFLTEKKHSQQIAGKKRLLKHYTHMEVEKENKKT